MLEPTAADWADPKRANARIREIVERHRRERHAEMRKRVAALQALSRELEVETSKANGHAGADDHPPGTGRNRPPAEIEDPAVFLPPALETLNEQPSVPAGPERAAGATRRLRDWLGAVVAWRGGKADRFFGAFAAESGKQGGGWAVRPAALGVAGSLLDVATRVAELRKAATLWLRTLGAPL